MYRIPLFHKGIWSAQTYDSFLGAINNMRANGYQSVGTFLLNVLRDYGFQYPLPFSSTVSEYGLYTRNKHSSWGQYYGPGYSGALRWNAEWQIYEEVRQGIGTRKVSGEAPYFIGEYSYNQWQRSRMGDKTIPTFVRKSSIRPQETRLVPRWARCE
jgi:hypothetical protein